MEADFAEALTRTNMGVYYRRHGLTWHADLFLTSWRLLENYIVERDRQRIGVLHISNEGDAQHIRDLQLAPEVGGAGGGTFLLETVHAWARRRRHGYCVCMCSPTTLPQDCMRGSAIRTSGIACRLRNDQADGARCLTVAV